MTYELDDDQIRDYFTESAEDWVNAGYNPNDLRVYPTPLHRARVVCSLLESKPVPSRLADLGCGGGILPSLLRNVATRWMDLTVLPKCFGWRETLLSERTRQLRHG